MARELTQEWQLIDTAPKNEKRYILLYCPEDGTRWFATWFCGQWCGIDDAGIDRVGYSLGDKNYVTGWFVSHWQQLPHKPEPYPHGT